MSNSKFCHTQRLYAITGFTNNFPIRIIIDDLKNAFQNNIVVICNEDFNSIFLRSLWPSDTSGGGPNIKLGLVLPIRREK